MLSYEELTIKQDVEKVINQIEMNIIFTETEKSKETIEKKHFYTLQDIQGLKNLKSFFKPKHKIENQQELFVIPVPSTSRCIAIKNVWIYLCGINPTTMELKAEYIDSTFTKDIPFIIQYYSDHEPLKRLSTYFSTCQGDKYFWIHLSQNSDLFQITIVDELARNKQFNQKNIILHKPYQFDCCQYDDENIPNRTWMYQGKTPSVPLKFVPPINTRIFYSWFHSKRFNKIALTTLNIDPLSLLNSVPLNKIQNCIEDILSIPGVTICGGFPLFLVNNVYQVKSSSTQDVNEDVDVKVSELDENFLSDLFFPKDIDLFFHTNDGRFQHENKNSDHFILERIQSILTILRKTAEELETPLVIKSYENSLSFSFHITFRTHNGEVLKNYSKVEFQIIKRLYSNLDEILLGFDLDASACALIKNEKKHKLEIVMLPRCEYAIKYGINLVNPLRQSFTFANRLAKYYGKGYKPYIVNASYRAFQQFFQDTTEEFKQLVQDSLPERIRSTDVKFQQIRIPLQHTLGELVFKFSGHYEYYYFSANKSDYENNFLSCMILKPYKKKALEEKEVRQLIDQSTISWLMQLANVNSWKITETMSQIQGSFNPTNFDYYAYNVKVASETLSNLKFKSIVNSLDIASTQNES